MRDDIKVLKNIVKKRKYILKSLCRGSNQNDQRVHTYTFTFKRKT